MNEKKEVESSFSNTSSQSVDYDAWDRRVVVTNPSLIVQQILRYTLNQTGLSQCSCNGGEEMQECQDLRRQLSCRRKRIPPTARVYVFCNNSYWQGPGHLGLWGIAMPQP